MLDLDDATEIIRAALPKGDIAKVIEYEDLFVFQVFVGEKFEREMDPFYSVNRKTSEFRDFSIITDGDMNELFRLFKEAKRV
jgi:hypothetical protein